MIDLRMTSGTRRSFIHYSFAVLIMWIYGGQVCPLVETITLSNWFVELVIIFGCLYLMRLMIEKQFLRPIPYQKKAFAQFKFELLFSFCAGIIIALINFIIYNFSPVESGLKMIFGAMALGFFTAIDMALLKERTIDNELSKNHQEILIDQNYFPMTRKFAIVATGTCIIFSGIIILVIVKDLSWLIQVKASDTNSAGVSIIKEVLFITSIFLCHIFNIILSYAKNLKLCVQKENYVLKDVANGNLDNHIVVSSNDEFGIMGRYTNIMIDKLTLRTRQVHQARDVTIMALAILAETRDNATGEHMLRTQNYVRAIALKLKSHPLFYDQLDKTAIDLLYKSAPLHDIGKVGVPDRILLKTEKLDDREFEIMKKHAVYGKEALEKAAVGLEENNFLKIAQTIAYSHHEKWDGSGYPLGLKTNNIPLPGRLMAIADVYDALINKRVYKKAFSHKKAMAIIKQGRGNHFDPDIHDAFLQIEDEIIAIAKKFSQDN